MSLQDSFVFKYCLSATAATISETVTYPLDLTKTRLQIQGERNAYSNKTLPSKTLLPNVQPYRGMLRTATGIVKEEGLFKLWQGLTPAVYRHIVYTGCRMATYEWLRENILKKNERGEFPIWKAVIAGMTAGGFAQFIASPTDLVKVQMQMEGRRKLEGKPLRVKNAVHAVKRVIQESGLRGLWKGWVPNVQRAALVNLGDLTTYDTAKHTILKYTSLQDNYVTHSISSVCSGFASALFGTPADVIKTRIMNQPTDPRNGRPMYYRSSWDCLLQSVRNEGLPSLYKGFLPTWARMAPWSLTFWLVYEQIRRVTGTVSF